MLLEVSVGTVKTLSAIVTKRSVSALVNSENFLSELEEVVSDCLSEDVLPSCFGTPETDW